MKNLFEVLDNHFNSHKDSLNGTIVLGDDDNVCRKHIVIPFTSVNREAWNNFFTICCNGWSEYADYMHSWKKPVIYIGRQGHKGAYSFIIAIGTKDAEGGYFHVYETSNLDTYYDGLKEFETDEDYEYFLIQVTYTLKKLLDISQ